MMRPANRSGEGADKKQAEEAERCVGLVVGAQFLHSALTVNEGNGREHFPFS